LSFPKQFLASKVDRYSGVSSPIAIRNLSILYRPASRQNHRATGRRAAPRPARPPPRNPLSSGWPGRSAFARMPAFDPRWQNCCPSTAASWSVATRGNCHSQLTDSKKAGQPPTPSSKSAAWACGVARSGSHPLSLPLLHARGRSPPNCPPPATPAADFLQRVSLTARCRASPRGLARWGWRLAGLYRNGKLRLAMAEHCYSAAIPRLATGPNYCRCSEHGPSRAYGATAARLTPDQKVGSSNLFALIFNLVLTARGTPRAESTSLAFLFVAS
jgi:hypothetical protein